LTSYDVLVIGHDPGGIAAALLAAEAGLRVAVVAPFLAPAEIVLNTLCVMALDRSVAQSSAPPDWSTFRTQCHELADQAHLDIVRSLQAAQATYVEGTGALLGSGQARIKTTEDDFEVLAQHIILATGSSPRAISGTPDSPSIVAAEQLNLLPHCPDTAVVVGSEVEGLETAWALQVFGCQVTWALPQESSLSGFEAADISHVQSVLKKQGVDVRRYTKLRAVEVHEDHIIGILDDRANGQRQDIRSTQLVSATGRRPNSAGLGLEAIDAVLDKRGHIQVDSGMQTGEAKVYAVGDLLPTLSWPHVARAEGMVAAQHLLGRPFKAIRYQRIPVHTRSQPAMAAIGLTEAEAMAEGFLVRRGACPLAKFGPREVQQSREIGRAHV